MNQEKGLAINRSGSGQALKTTINFIDVGEPKRDQNGILPYAVFALLAVLLFCKFAVIDRYARLWDAQSRAESLQKELDAGFEKMYATDETADQYYHYTWSGMNEEELKRASRVDVAQLVQYISTRVSSVNSYTLVGDQLTVNITAPSLESIGRLTREVEKRSIVESCSMPSAQTGLTGQESANGVDAQLVIYIRSSDDAQE